MALLLAPPSADLMAAQKGNWKAAPRAGHSEKTTVARLAQKTAARRVESKAHCLVALRAAQTALPLAVLKVQ